jgi:hypothetical protein
MTAKLTAGGHFLFTKSKFFSGLTMLSLKAPLVERLRPASVSRQHMELRVSQFVKALNNEAQAASWNGNQKFHN